MANPEMRVGGSDTGTERDDGDRPQLIAHNRRAAALIIVLLFTAVAVGITTWGGTDASGIMGGGTATRPSAASPSSDVGDDLILVTPRDTSISFAIPAGWHAVASSGLRTWQYARDAALGRLNISFGIPLDATWCLRTCFDLSLPAMERYDADDAVQLVTHEIEVVAGQRFHPLSGAGPGVLSAAVANDGWSDPEMGPVRHRVFVLAFPERIAILTWTEPRGTFDADTVDRVLRHIRVDSTGPTYGSPPVQDVTDYAGRYAVSVPDVWYAWTQPLLDGATQPSVRRFGRREMTVSVGDRRGTIVLCDATVCSRYAGQRTAKILGSTIRHWLPRAKGRDVTGQSRLAARRASLVIRQSGTASDRRHREIVYGIEQGRPFVIAFDLSLESVNQTAIDAVVASFTFFDPPHRSRRVTERSADRTFGVALDDASWYRRTGPDASAIYLGNRQPCSGAPAVSCQRTYATIRMGDVGGTVRTCDAPAAVGGLGQPQPLESCRVIVAGSVADLADALGHEIAGPPTLFIDGEPAYVTRWIGQEPPARGGQQLMYALAMHAGRPVILRLHTSEPGNGTLLPALLRRLADGFRFLDGASCPMRGRIDTRPGPQASL